MHQGVGVTEQAYHHKNLGDLRLGIAKLLHGSRVELESGLTPIEGGNDHGDDLLNGFRHTSAFHDGFVLAPIGFQMLEIVGCRTKVHRDKFRAEYAFDLVVDFADATSGSAFSDKFNRGHRDSFLLHPVPNSHDSSLGRLPYSTRYTMPDGLRRALSFLTVCPLQSRSAWTPETLGSSMVYYPLVGTLIGLCLWGLAVLLGLLFPVPLVSALLLASLLLLTGGLHIDGLSDTVDGLSGSYNREDALRIFKDPHVGSMAVAAVAMLLLVKYTCLSALKPDVLGPVLVLMATLSRYAMVQLACFSPYARATGGLGEPFVRGIRPEHHRYALLLALCSVLLFGRMRGVLLGALIILATFGLQVYFQRRLGGITGDVLGATNEVSEMLVLLLAVIVY